MRRRALQSAVYCTLSHGLLLLAPSDLDAYVPSEGNDAVCTAQRGRGTEIGLNDFEVFERTCMTVSVCGNAKSGWSRGSRAPSRGALAASFCLDPTSAAYVKLTQ